MKIKRNLIHRFGMLVYAIKKCHQLRDGHLDVKNHGSFYSYTPTEDVGYMEYCRNRNIVQKYPRLARVLDWFI
jgi:hypothetical protein